MKLFNKGHSRIIHAESHKSGSACEPQKVFTVSEKLGKKLKKMYPKQLENLDEATAKFKAPVPEEKPKDRLPVATPVMPEKTEEEIAEEQEAESLGVSVEDLRELKE